MQHKSKAKNIDEYIAEFPKNVQLKLQQLRKIIQNSAPDARETISYAIPTFKMKKNLVHFAAFKDHIGFYPTPEGMEKLEKELSGYKKGKGSLHFSFSEPLPERLIADIVKLRLEADNKLKK